MKPYKIKIDRYKQRRQGHIEYNYDLPTRRTVMKIFETRYPHLKFGSREWEAYRNEYGLGDIVIFVQRLKKDILFKKFDHYEPEWKRIRNIRFREYSA